MIEKPKRPKKIANQDNKQPQTIQELIRRYDLDNTKIYDFLDELVGSLKETQTVVSSTEPTGEDREKVWIQKGKNLFDSNLYITNLAEGSSSSYIYLKLEPNTNYTMSTNLPYYLEGANFFVACGKVTSVSTSENGVGNERSRSINSDSKGYVTIAYRKIAGFTGDLTSYNFQLEKGSNATEYEEYVEPAIYIKNDNNVYEKFINKEEIPKVKKISSSEFFESTSYNVTEFECYQYGNLINIQRMVIYNVKGISQNSEIAKIKPKYVPIGNKAIRLLGCSGEAIIDYVCYLSPNKMTLIQNTSPNITSANCYVFNTTYTIN